MSNAEQLHNLFGLDVDRLEAHAPESPDYPNTVPGRVLHIDGDFLAYQVAADDTKSIEDMMHNHDVAVETLRLLSGAELAVSHLTASHGDKGRRFDIAIQKEYQGNRKNKVKPKHLHTIKSWMEQARHAVSHEGQEADDGLCQANYHAVITGSPELSVLVSKDKDLQMCRGTHLDWDYGTLEFVDGYGYIELDRSKSSPKIIGKGTAYFWAQMLTGDAADSIQGLPKISTKAQAELLGQKDKNPKTCGPVMVYDLLKNVKTDKEAFQLVKFLYEETGKQVGYKHWSTGDDVPWGQVLVSEAKLLWMRRVPDENDVLNFFKERCV